MENSDDSKFLAYLDSEELEKVYKMVLKALHDSNRQAFSSEFSDKIINAVWRDLVTIADKCKRTDCKGCKYKNHCNLGDITSTIEKKDLKFLLQKVFERV